MATVGEEEFDYESDPEEAKRSLVMRRRVASDDEESEGEGREKSRVDRRIGGNSDDADGEGGAAEYDDEEELDVKDEEVDEEEIEEREEEEEQVYGEGDHASEVVDGVESSAVKYGDERRSVEESMEAHGGEKAVEEEEKKESEPFAVPTAGVFYMHDDRFRDNAGGRHRHTYGGRKLWESKDDRKWGHDKFEEMTSKERRYNEGRRFSKGYQGRGRGGHIGRGYGRGNRSKVCDNVNDQSQVSKVFRGKGPRRYEPTMKNNNQIISSQNRQSGRSSGKPLEKPLHANSGKAHNPKSNMESDLVPSRQSVFASSLNSASPPFYPSGASDKDVALSENRDVHAGSMNNVFSKPNFNDGFSMPHANTALRGKNIAVSVGMDKLYIDDPINSASGKTMNNLQVPTSGSPVLNAAAQAINVRPQGRVIIPGQINYQPASSNNQVSRASLAQVHHAQRNGAQSRGHSTMQTPDQQLGQRPSSGSQASSPPKTAQSTNSLESGDVESSSESSKAKTALVGKGKGIAQGSGRGPLIYGGGEVMGATGGMGVSHSDQNFPGTPAFLPVMQFGGQHPGGIGVPAVGMAFPGYVTQPQLGLGNSEMTWLPVLAGAAGALGASYCSPYLAVDDAYHGRPSGQMSSGNASKDNNENKPNNDPGQEIVNDEFGQRQNKPRRYSEMNFGQ